MYALRPALREYDWGTRDDLPRILGFEPPGGPVAEAWWGAHPAAPSLAEVAGRAVPLGDLIARDPEGALGPDLARAFEGRLPFLLKILAIAKPLSIQVHPSAEDAREGFAREEAEGVPIDAPARVFRDSRHKPEMIVAITPMVLLSGFRPAASTRRDIERLDHPDAVRLAAALRGPDQVRAVADYVRLALTDIDAASVANEIALAGRAPDASPALGAAAAAAAHFPGDPGVAVALAMNCVNLEPGEACFTPDGTVHSYQSGVGLEIMSNSDNVIRAGLTTKHVDVARVLAAASTAPGGPVAPETERDDGVTMLWPRADEFLLSLIDHGTSEFVAHPRIVLAVDGPARVASEAAGERDLAPGEAVFVPYSDGEFAVASGGLTAVAGVPLTEADRRIARAPLPPPRR